MKRQEVYARVLDLVNNVNSIKCAAVGRDDLELSKVELEELRKAGESLKEFCKLLEDRSQWD